MHAVHVSSVHKPYDVRILEKECRSLVENGIQTSFVVATPKPETKYGVRLVPFKRSNGSRVRRVFQDGSAAIRTALALDGDIYHLHDPELLLFLRPLVKSGKRVVFDMHENLPKAIMDKPWVPRHLRAVLRVLVTWYERRVLPELPVVFAEESYRDSYPWIKNYVVVQNFPRVEQFEEFRKNRTPGQRLAYMGGVSPNRGSMITLQALGILREKGVHLGFDCVGPCSASHLEQLKAMCHSKDLRDVRFYGAREPREGYAIIKDASLGLAVLSAQGNYMNSYPTKAFEYICLGMPVVLSDFPLYQDLMRKVPAGLCVDPSSPEALARAIETLVVNGTWVAERGEQARKALLERGLTWDAEFRKLWSFYAQNSLLPKGIPKEGTA